MRKVEMQGQNGAQSGRFKAFGRKDIDQIPQFRRLSLEEITAMKAVSAVLPFRVNNYVLEELIDWNDAPDDPIYQLTFPQRGMLSDQDFDRMADLIQKGTSEAEVGRAAREIQMRLNPHPAGQHLNVPLENGQPLPGIQHKYRETVLFFPTQGQTCHAYCTYCFRWAQFVGLEDLKFASLEVDRLVKYLHQHREVTDVLLTGGDPLVMKTRVLRRYIEPLLSPGMEHIRSIRIGSKAPAYWPQRFVSDRDSDDLLRLFEEVRRAGKHLALMAHYSHPRELETPIGQQALQRMIGTGTTVRCQAPLIRHVNDNPRTWAQLWQEQVRLGAIPYYMFVERDTGAKGYFEVPLARAWKIFRRAYRQVSGLCRTVRGPSMSSTPGKVLVEGVTRVAGQDVFVLKFIQGRDPSWVDQTFFARYDPKATWLDELRPAFGESEFFFEKELRGLHKKGHQVRRHPNEESSFQGLRSFYDTP